MRAVERRILDDLVVAMGYQGGCRLRKDENVGTRGNRMTDNEMTRETKEHFIDKMNVDASNGNDSIRD